MSDLTNRQLLERAIADIKQISTNPVIGPSAYDYLNRAVARLGDAAQFALDETEQDTAKFNRS